MLIRTKLLTIFRIFFYLFYSFSFLSFSSFRAVHISVACPFSICIFKIRVKRQKNVCLFSFYICCCCCCYWLYIVIIVYKLCDLKKTNQIANFFAYFHYLCRVYWKAGCCMYSYTLVRIDRLSIIISKINLNICHNFFNSQQKKAIPSDFFFSPITTKYETYIFLYII